MKIKMRVGVFVYCYVVPNVGGIFSKIKYVRMSIRDTIQSTFAIEMIGTTKPRINAPHVLMQIFFDTFIEMEIYMLCIYVL